MMARDSKNTMGQAYQLGAHPERKRKIESHSCVGWIFLQRTIGTRGPGDHRSALDDTGISPKRAVLLQNRTRLPAAPEASRDPSSPFNKQTTAQSLVPRTKVSLGPIHADGKSP